jgi:hypothetical protein
MSQRRSETDAYGWRTDTKTLDTEGDYRYLLRRTREGGDGSHLMIVGLNPSNAGQEDDPHKPDNTVQVVERWASRIGRKFGALPLVHAYSAITFVNLFAWRHAVPEELDLVFSDRDVDAVGPRNLLAIGFVLEEPPNTVVVAWGDAEDVTDQAEVAKQIQAVETVLAGQVIEQVGTLTRQGRPRHGRSWQFKPCDGLLRPYPSVV